MQSNNFLFFQLNCNWQRQIKLIFFWKRFRYLNPSYKNCKKLTIIIRRIQLTAYLCMQFKIPNDNHVHDFVGDNYMYRAIYSWRQSMKQWRNVYNTTTQSIQTLTYVTHTFVVSTWFLSSKSRIWIRLRPNFTVRISWWRSTGLPMMPRSWYSESNFLIRTFSVDVCTTSWEVEKFLA